MTDPSDSLPADLIDQPALTGRSWCPDARLVGLNVALLVVLVAVGVGGASDRQTGGGPGVGTGQPVRGRGEYTMISGRVQGSSTHGVYILDAANHELVALTWDRNRARLEPLGYRNLADDAVLFQGGR